MPKRKRARRFDPRPGVSQATVDAEAERVAQEAGDYRIYALAELRQCLAERVAAAASAELELKDLMARLPEREQLVLRSLLTRDAFHLLATYISYVRSLSGEVAISPKAKAAPPEPAVPFSEWLFGPP